MPQTHGNMRVKEVNGMNWKIINYRRFDINI